MMIVAIGVISCLVSSWIMSHFGMKPVNGGRPARERRVSIAVAFSIGVLVHEMSIVDSFRTLIWARDRNTVEVIIV